MIEIIPGTLRDICYIAANLREDDRREIMATAQMASPTVAAVLSYEGSFGTSWVALYDGVPSAAFGFTSPRPLQPHIAGIWAFGTKRFKRCVPAMTRLCLNEWPIMARTLEIRRMEVRSLASHDIAHRWLSAIGARREGLMRGYGINGEDFELWAFLIEDFDHVFQHS